MTDQTKRVALRLGEFAISAEGFEDPSRPIRFLVRAMQQTIEETPEFVETGFSIDDEVIDRMKAWLQRKGEGRIEDYDVVPGLILVRRADAPEAEGAPDIAVERAQDIAGDVTTGAAAMGLAAAAAAMPAPEEPEEDPAAEAQPDASDAEARAAAAAEATALGTFVHEALANAPAPVFTPAELVEDTPEPQADGPALEPDSETAITAAGLGAFVQDTIRNAPPPVFTPPEVAEEASDEAGEDAASEPIADVEDDAFEAALDAQPEVAETPFTAPIFGRHQVDLPPDEEEAVEEAVVEEPEALDDALDAELIEDRAEDIAQELAPEPAVEPEQESLAEPEPEYEFLAEPEPEPEPEPLNIAEATAALQSGEIEPEPEREIVSTFEEGEFEILEENAEADDDGSADRLRDIWEDPDSDAEAADPAEVPQSVFEVQPPEEAFEDAQYQTLDDPTPAPEAPEEDDTALPDNVFAAIQQPASYEADQEPETAVQSEEVFEEILDDGSFDPIPEGSVDDMLRTAAPQEDTADLEAEPETGPELEDAPEPDLDPEPFPEVEVEAAELHPEPEPEPEPAPAAPINIFAPPPPAQPAAEAQPAEPAPEPVAELKPEPTQEAEPSMEPQSSPSAAPINIFAPPPAAESVEAAAAKASAEVHSIHDAVKASAAAPASATPAAEAAPINIFAPPPSAEPTAPSPAAAPEPAAQAGAGLAGAGLEGGTRQDSLETRFRSKVMMGAPGQERTETRAEPAAEANPTTVEGGALQPADLARAANAETVPELLTASAAYLTLVKDQNRFTRREVMTVFDQLPGEHSRSLEARIKGYGKLVRNGHLVLVGDGMFALNQDERDRFSEAIDQV